MLRNMLAYLAFAAVAAAADLAGAALVTRASARGSVPLRYCVAAGAGFMLAAAFVRMLPESTHVPHAYVFVLLGYFGVHLVEHGVVPHFHFGEETHVEEMTPQHVGYAALLGLVIHTFFDGVAIASGFLVSTWLGGVIFLAVFLHKLPEGFTVSSLMLASGQSRRTALLASVLLGAATLGGVFLMNVLRAQVGFALPISAGVTVYVAASDLMPEVNREPGVAMAFVVFIGVAFLLVLHGMFRF